MSILWNIIVVLYCSICCAQNLLRNPGFENGVTYWTHDGFIMQLDFTQIHEGVASAKCTGRTRTSQGPTQAVSLKPGGRYAFSAYIKLFDNLQGSEPQEVIVNIAIDSVNGTYDFELTSRLHVTSEDGWVMLGSDFMFPNISYSSARLSIGGPSPETSFYFDDASIVEIPELIAWEQDANQRIDKLRKSNIHFQFNVDPNFDIGKLQVQIDHSRHLFGFGSLLRSEYLLDPDYRQYQNIAFYMFNWATLQEFSWRKEAWDSTPPDFSVPVSAADVLHKHGLKVRGHCLFWAVQGHEPEWVTPLSGQAMKDAIQGHINNMTDITKGKLAQWIVNNELLHGSFYEDSTDDPSISQHMFQAVQEADPDVGLFLNDYDVVASGGHTAQYLEQILKFKTANVGLTGVGVESHFDDLSEPDITLVQARLDRIGQAGVPVWVSELSLSSHNESIKADWYETVLRLFFSHPVVEGVIFWGFWDHDTNPLEALLHGNSYTLDEAGKRFLRLTKEEWSTHENRSLSAGTSFDVRGFQGDYEVVVNYSGKPIVLSSFTLGKEDLSVTINIQGDGSEIQLPDVVDPFRYVDIDYETTSQNLQNLGQASSSSSSARLQCVTRWSQQSAVGDDVSVSVGCNAGEVLTGCSSYLTNDDWRRDGEQITFSNGTAMCTAYNGYRSTASIQAIARCCSLQGLQCQYRSAGPSGTGVNDQVIVPCENYGYPLGCGTWTYDSESDGTAFTDSMCVGQNDDPKYGVYSFAVCCQKPGLQCVTMYSDPSGQQQGDRSVIQCPPGLGFAMTGCNVYTPNGRAAGAYIEEMDDVHSCMAANGYQKYGQDAGVKATALCCRVN
ncbi:hypothetical protein BsWGS_00379 [Bradybaena similaris]